MECKKKKKERKQKYRILEVCRQEHAMLFLKEIGIGIEVCIMA